LQIGGRKPANRDNEKDGADMSSGEMFKKAVIGGFDKADVMQYFESQQKKHREETAALREELAEARSRESALQNQCGDQADTIEELSGSLTAERLTIQQQTEEIETRQKKNDELQRELSAQKALNTELQMKKNVLEENLKNMQAKNQELEEELADITARFAERTGIEIGELLIEAKINAKRIIEKAKSEAEQVRTEYSRQCGEAENRFSGLNEQLNGVEEHFRTVSDETIAELERVRTELTGIQAEFVAQSEQARAETEALNADQSYEA
jgi:chromosome segregation ATPase